MAIIKERAMTFLSRANSGVLGVALVLLGGCASFTSDGGFIAVEQAGAQLDKQVVWVNIPEQRSQWAERVAMAAID
jgi:hypothetical protein